jgi:hypothetical protein
MVMLAGRRHSRLELHMPLAAIRFDEFSSKQFVWE